MASLTSGGDRAGWWTPERQQHAIQALTAGGMSPLGAAALVWMKASIARLEAANLDTMQAWQIRQNLQDVFTMPSVASARKYLSRWHAWVSTCDLLPMKKAASTIMAKADEILRSISSNLSNGLLEAINGNVQAAKRKAKGYRTKHNLKLMVYLIAGGVLDALPT